MPTGEHPGRARRHRGFTYLWLLFALAAGAAAIAALGPVWSTALQRERELESMFRGQQMANAIGAWRNAFAETEASAASTSSPALPPQGPRELQDLLQDTRSPVPLRHLRRLYADPLTGAADWQLLRDASGAVVALHSRSQRPALITRGLPGSGTGAAVPVSARIYRPQAAPMAAAALP